jgi:hypothetical protein
LAWLLRCCPRFAALAPAGLTLARSRRQRRLEGARRGASDHREREDFGRLGERLGQLELATEAQSYEQAIGCTEKGEETSRLISCFGLTEGEADLVMLLHNEASRRAAAEKFARRQIDSAQV